MTHRESRDSSSLREPGCLPGVSAHLSLVLWCLVACLLFLPLSCGTFCQMLFVPCPILHALFLLLCCSVSSYVCLSCSVYFQFPCLFLCLLVTFSPMLLCITFFWFRNQRKKDTLPSSSNYKNPDKRSFCLSLHSQGLGTVPHCNLWVKLEENSSSLKEGRSSSVQSKQ